MAVVTSRASDAPVIIGIHEEPLDCEGRSCKEIAISAVSGALRDAGISLDVVDGVLAGYAWEDPSIMFASEIGSALGLEPKYVETVSFGGASPAMMVARGARAIEAGLCSVAVLVAASNRASGMGRGAAIAALRDVLDPGYEVPYGAFIPPVYALAAARFLYETGTTPEQLAAVAVMQRGHASDNADAARRRPLTVENVLASPMIASPLHRDECCLVTDFGAALVMTRQSLAQDLHLPVAVTGVGEAHDIITSASVPDLTRRSSAASAAAALGRAGLTPDQLDVIELYDSFTITVLMTLEDMGLAPRGRAGSWIEEGRFSRHGDLPLNTNGGMLSYRTGGMSHVVEAVRQLRGTACLQVDGAHRALVHGIGGVMSSHCSLVLEGRA